MVTELSSCNGDYMAHKLKTLITRPFKKRLATLWSGLSPTFYKKQSTKYLTFSLLFETVPGELIVIWNLKIPKTCSTLLYINIEVGKLPLSLCAKVRLNLYVQWDENFVWSLSETQGTYSYLVFNEFKHYMKNWVIDQKKVKDFKTNWSHAMKKRHSLL